MQMIIQALLVTSLIAGTFCQKIVFDNTALISPCITGARSGIDRYFITGTIGENITELLIQEWQPIVSIEMMRRSLPQFMPICQFLLREARCVASPTPRCGCFYNTTTDQAHFTTNSTLRVDDNNAVIRAKWLHLNVTSIYSNKNYTLQEIYDVNAAQLNLTVAGVTGNLSSGSCSFSLTPNKSNDLELCCSNTAKPCYPQIAFNGAVVNSNTETCVTYPASQLASDGVTGNLTLSYSVCDLTDYRQGSSCTITSKPDPPNPEDNNSALVVTLSVIIPIVVIALAVGIGYCFKARSTGQMAISNRGTNESTPKAD